MSEWVELICTYDETEAQIIKDVLESDNIEVVLRSMKISPYPVSFGRLGEVKLLVKNDDINNARRVLKIMSEHQGNESE
jgi:hypothetical protein